MQDTAEHKFNGLTQNHASFGIGRLNLHDPAQITQITYTD